MADDKATIRKVQKLIERQREIEAQLFAITEEIHKLVNGEPGIGEVLSRLEDIYDRLWCERYAPGQNNRYVWSYAKDRPQMKRLIRNIGVDEITARCQNYFANDEPFYVRSRHSFTVFVASINCHAGAVEASTRPADCTHTPACASDAAHTRLRAQERQR